jgi:hypothetical protein
MIAETTSGGVAMGEPDSTKSPLTGASRGFTFDLWTDTPGAQIPGLKWVEVDQGPTAAFALPHTAALTYPLFVV